MSVITLDNRSAEDIVEEHPLLKWLARMHHLDSRFKPERDRSVSKDFFLSPACSGRFGTMIEEDGAMALAAQDAPGDAASDLKALLSVTWASSAFARGVRGKDYLVLNCRDVAENQPDAVPGSAPVQLRVFFEMSSAMADALEAAAPPPTKLRIRPIAFKGGVPVRSIGAARAEIPLTFKPS